MPERQIHVISGFVIGWTTVTHLDADPTEEMAYANPGDEIIVDSALARIAVESGKATYMDDGDINPIEAGSFASEDIVREPFTSNRNSPGRRGRAKRG